MTARELKFINAFNAIPNVGASSLRLLRQKFGSLEEAWNAGENSLKEARLEKKTLESILWKKPSLHPDREMEKMIRGKIWMVDEDDPAFPSILKEVSQSPFLLYGRGRIEALSDLNPEKTFPAKLAVVGTRKPTAYGLEAVEYIIPGLVRTGLIIVSGLATGIDTKAHRETINNKGTTLAVLGSGIDPDSIFPPENKKLAEEITAAGGAVISEFSPGTPAVREHFPQRNRIVSGLSQGVLVIEAKEKSGALITARFALEQNRDVFAIPGSVFSLTSAGPNKLIQEGAKLVANSTDILEELGLNDNSFSAAENVTDKDNLSLEEKKILEILEEALDIDNLKQKTGLHTDKLIAILSRLELRGRIRSLGQDIYQRV